MKNVLKSKTVSYGLVELIDNCYGSPRYHIELNGSVREFSDDLSYLSNLFERNYY